VTLLVRGSTLGASMSQYLVSKVSELDNVDVRTGTEVVELEADTRLRAVALSSHDETGLTRLPLESLFICIGGVPRTHGITKAGLATDDAGFILTGAGVTASPGALDKWPLSRAPLPLETNRPGFFAAGDVRSGSIKRCSAAIGEGSMAVALVHHRLAELGAEQ
jgi:thioredoxin reductase (NADPH)